ncbi:fliH protein [Clostridium aestuarii]|uniref:FliH protein n=1 Tax=Clostridium aestuarii TaxID=338193 RepID=A0ABT4CZ69_9CLOT|nr:fliH protein [Clostridium aestuarii]MCY6483682.1 fliH protein [Clostridium aestuarii]
MLSSYKVIKNRSVVETGEKKIDTDYGIQKKKELSEKNAKDFIENYEVLAKTMLENARKQSDNLLAKAYQEARIIEEEAYKKAYEKGEKEGYQNGYEKGAAEADVYCTMVKSRAENEVRTLNNNAEALLHEAKKEYVKYLDEKKEEIKSLILTIIENVFKREIKDENAVSSMLIDAMEMAVKSKTVIIKCRSNYVEDIKSTIDIWKQGVVFKGEIFIVPDDNLQEGSAIIQRENGKIEININDALDKIKEIIENEA